MRLFRSFVPGSLLIAALVGTACATTSADTRQAFPGLRNEAAAPVSLTLVDGSGQPLPTFDVDGEIFVRAQPGTTYAIRLVNHGPTRVEAVVSVDGRDVITGAPANYKRHRGYVIEPYGAIEIEGFRRSWSEAAAFTFVPAESSFSATSGTPAHVGVIGVALFDEKPSARGRALGRPGEDSVAYRDENGVSFAPAADARLGTRAGAAVERRLSVAPFERRRARRPESVIVVGYADAAAFGPDRGPAPPTGFAPDPFPIR